VSAAWGPSLPLLRCCFFFIRSLVKRNPKRIQIMPLTLASGRRSLRLLSPSYLRRRKGEQVCCLEEITAPKKVDSVTAYCSFSLSLHDERTPKLKPHKLFLFSLHFYMQLCVSSCGRGPGGDLFFLYMIGL
jgi:hypothetical protein